jgi:hypothetical protein
MNRTQIRIAYVIGMRPDSMVKEAACWAATASKTNADNFWKDTSLMFGCVGSRMVKWFFLYTMPMSHVALRHPMRSTFSALDLVILGHILLWIWIRVTLRDNVMNWRITRASTYRHLAVTIRDRSILDSTITAKIFVH